jgi:signal peptidase I
MSLKSVFLKNTIAALLWMGALILHLSAVSKVKVTLGYIGFFFVFIFIIVTYILIFKTYKNKTENQWVSKKVIDIILDWLSFLTLSLVSILILFSFFILSSRVYYNSMSPTLEVGDRTLIFHFRYAPKRNDLVIIEINRGDYPLIPNSTFIDRDTGEVRDTVLFVKRIGAVPGDTIEFVHFNEVTERSQVMINGQIYHSPQCDLMWVKAEEIEIMRQGLDEQGIVKEGLFFVFGDNFERSFDSRNYGPNQEIHIVGQVIFRLWPFGGVR